MKSLTKSLSLIIALLICTNLNSANFSLSEKFRLNPDNESIFKNKNLRIDDDASFGEGSQILNIGIGFGGGNYYNSYKGPGYSAGRSPLFNLSYEIALTRLGPGFIGIGPYFSFQTAHQGNNNIHYKGGIYYYKHIWNYYTVAARAAYHLDFLNIPAGELYAGPIVGVRINSYTFDTNNPDPDANYYRLNEKTIYPVAALFIGGRWNFSTRVGLFAELASGYGMSFGVVGLCFRF